jgi:hypothetical protein
MGEFVIRAYKFQETSPGPDYARLLNNPRFWDELRGIPYRVPRLDKKYPGFKVWRISRRPDTSLIGPHSDGFQIVPARARVVWQWDGTEKTSSPLTCPTTLSGCNTSRLPRFIRHRAGDYATEFIILKMKKTDNPTHRDDKTGETYLYSIHNVHILRRC